MFTTQLAAQRNVSLNGTWRLTYGPVFDYDSAIVATSPPTDWKTVPASVPGNVELDLMAAGQLNDLRKGNQIYSALKLETYQWWYRRQFESPSIQPGERVDLVFEGVDCLAKIWVNGKLAGDVANMLIPHRLDVTRLIASNGVNDLLVRIDPVVTAGNRTPHMPGEYASAGHWESLSLRKAPHMYGWDIMPRLVSAGLWRDVRFEVVPTVNWHSVYWATQSVNNQAKTAVLILDWELASNFSSLESWKMQVTLEQGGLIAFNQEFPILSQHGREILNLKDVAFWWPHGYGQPALYEATLRLLDPNLQVRDVHHCRIGIRTIELRKTDITTPEHPGDFSFRVNGESIFIKGTNWVPLDGLHSRDQEQLETVFPMLIDLNCNMVRCWGGNVYESDRFFALCDEAGILVWQDFALACALYPQTPGFLQQMQQEAESIIPRLRNHPALALWAGNNEGDEVYGWIGMSHLDPNHDRISREVLPGAVHRLDPYRTYLPSSPYRSPALFADGNNPDWMPEVHLWGPRGYFKDPFYTQSPAHFVSEIGYHGCPSQSSLALMFDADSVFPWIHAQEWNDQWLTKSVRFHPLSTDTAGRNDLMLKQIHSLFGEVPGNLGDFIRASQITQAEAMKFFVEFWRQGKGRRNGILWWNLRDGWPIISDSVVDYYNQKKLAYSYIKQVQQDVQVICGEAADGQHPVVVVNDTLAEVKGQVQISQLSPSRALFEESFSSPRNGRIELGTIPVPNMPAMWRIKWQLRDGSSHQSHYLAAHPPIRLQDYLSWMKELGMALP